VRASKVKTKLVLIAAMFAALISSAQTNSIIFPQLLSPTNSVLMTNAEFRMISVPKIYFKNDAGYRSFYPGELNSNVLTALHTSIEQIAAQQQKIIDDAARAYAEAHPVYQAPPPPVDDIFDRAKKRMDDADINGDLPDAIDHITESLEKSYSEVIENSILNGADGTDVANIERERNLEKKKILEYALPLLKKEMDAANQAAAVAQSNRDAFNADPVGYLSKSTNAEDRKLAKDLSEQTNTPSK